MAAPFIRKGIGGFKESYQFPIIDNETGKRGNFYKRESKIRRIKVWLGYCIIFIDVIRLSEISIILS